MDDLIPRSKAIEALLKQKTPTPSVIRRVLRQVPGVDGDSLRPKGRWEKSEDDYCGLNLWKCSLCREEWCFEIDDDVKDLNYNYCPNCGAKMEG